MNQKPTCPGDCCVVFFLGGDTHDQVKSIEPACRDDRFLLDMIVPLKAEEAAERYRRLIPLERQDPAKLETILNPENVDQTFACRHFDEQTRRCREYASRPRLCRSYPYGKPCQHGCDCRANFGYPFSPRAKRNLARLSMTAGRLAERKRTGKEPEFI